MKNLKILYHWCISTLASIWYGFPSRSMKIIGVTGTKGKSTTSYMIAKIFEEQGESVAMIGSLGYKINSREWSNPEKMTMPGRFQLQKFLSDARQEKVKYLVLEVTSEGIAQKRLNGITVDCAVFTNLHKEHIESHGSFENYLAAKKQLFQKTKNIHVINVENQYSDEFLSIPARRKITYGMNKGELTQAILGIKLKISGAFNIYNALAAIGVAHI
jgi:UDP-N-acetylmuramoyl-L-alanyl-D-glutamate--2,6-diaminopimelate ligase